MARRKQPIHYEGPSSPKDARYAEHRAATWWKDEYYVKCFKLAQNGLDDVQLSKALGVTYKTFERWLARKPALADSLKQARDGNPGLDLRDYIYNRLDPSLRGLWDQLLAIREAPDAAALIERALAGKGEKVRQHLFLYALASTNWDASEACYRVNVSLAKLTDWTNNDEEFARLVTEVEFHKGNYFENALVGLVREREPGAVKFVNQTYNARRGYGKKVAVEHSGMIGHVHAHAVIEADDLSHLPVEQRRTILEALERKEAKALPGGKILSDTETED